MTLLETILLELPILGLWSFFFSCLRDVGGSLCCQDQKWRRQFLRKFLGKAWSICQADSERVYLGDTLCFPMCWLLCWWWAPPFPLWLLCKWLKWWVVEDEGLRAGTITECLARLFKHGSGVLWVSFVFCQMVYRFHMLTLSGAMSHIC